MAYQRKTQDEWQIHQNWGCGFEEVSAYETFKEARADLRLYRENQPEAPAKLVLKRIPL